MHHSTDYLYTYIYTVYRDSVNDLLKTSQRSNSYYPSMTHCGIIFVPRSTAISLTTTIAFHPLCDAALCSTTARGSSWKKLRQKSQIHTVIFHKTFQSWNRLGQWGWLNPWGTHDDPWLLSQNLSCLMGKAMGLDVLISPNFQNHPLVGWQMMKNGGSFRRYDRSAFRHFTISFVTNWELRGNFCPCAIVTNRSPGVSWKSRYDPPGRCEYGWGFKLTKLKILGLWLKTGCPPNPWSIIIYNHVHSFSSSFDAHRDSGVPRFQDI